MKPIVTVVPAFNETKRSILPMFPLGSDMNYGSDLLGVNGSFYHDCLRGKSKKLAGTVDHERNYVKRISRS